MSRKEVDLHRYIDQTLLKPTATKEQIIPFCEEAAEHHFRSVCIPPSFVTLASEILVSTDVDVCTVIGFPLGYSTTETKVFELEKAMEQGASELDIVINQGLLKSGNLVELRQEIDLLTKLVHKNYNLVKWIVETAYLNKQELITICDICLETNVDFIKTSTGFANAGAQLEDVKLWRKQIGAKNMLIKASGGIRTKEDALAFIDAGASRLGCSSGVQIING